MAMERVITIHGIKTTGAWQEQVQTVLDPHFECIPFKYPHYRKFGALKLIQDPWVILPASLIALLSFWEGIRPLGSWWIVTGALFLAYIVSYIRRRIVLHKLKIFLDDYMGYGDRPNLIAHSFGTYLAGACTASGPVGQIGCKS